MGRHDRQPSRHPAPTPAPSAVAPSPAPGVSEDTPSDVGSPLPPPATAVEPPAALTAAPRLLALVRVFAGHGVEYAPGDPIPDSVAVQLSEGEHWCRET